MLIDKIMRSLIGKFNNLLEYTGIGSKSYFHAQSPILYDPDDMHKYYMDLTIRADYDGPFDDNDVPLLTAQGMTTYHPVHIIFYALGNFELYKSNHDDEKLIKCKRAGDWLVGNQTADGTWLSPFKMPKFNINPPSRSAMTQGLAMSFLLRAYDEIRIEEYLESAVSALEVFKRAIDEGGVTSYTDGCSFYEEYPGQPVRHVLNGFIYALWGLYDMARFLDNNEAKNLFTAGLETLVKWLPEYDIGYWSLYHIDDSKQRHNPATVHYHKLHISQLEILHLITGKEIFKEYRDKWELYSQNRLNAVRTLPAKIAWDILGS